MMKVALRDIEYYLPSRIESGKELVLDNPDWRIDDIEAKTGIKQRHISEPNETSVDMAVTAAERLLTERRRAEGIDFLILVTQSPDYLIPTSACILQDRLGLDRNVTAFDVNLGCSGFIYGLSIGGGLIASNQCERGLLICSETYSKFIGADNRVCRPVFSDGAAAVLLERSPQERLGPFIMGTDGSGFGNLIAPGSGMRQCPAEDKAGQLVMNGTEVFMFTMNMIPKSVNALLEKSGLALDDIDLFVFHQASKLVMDNIIRRLSLPEEKVETNYQMVGNTVSASIPIALKQAVQADRLHDGDLVMLVGFGVGYSWGGCLLRWGVE
jgi:3-oxoacyl-[acyl-carrier-protein] synthase-3